MTIKFLLLFVGVIISTSNAYTENESNTIRNQRIERLFDIFEILERHSSSYVIVARNRISTFLLSGKLFTELNNMNDKNYNPEKSFLKYTFEDNSITKNEDYNYQLNNEELNWSSNNSVKFEQFNRDEISSVLQHMENLTSIKLIIQKIRENNLELKEFCFILKSRYSKDQNFEYIQSKSRNLVGQYLNQDGDTYPALKGLGTTIVVMTCIAAFIFWLGHILKQLDTSLFWILLGFIQLTYLTLMIELYHPLNLIYFLDRLEPWKLDLAWIVEFTTIRDKLMKDLNFKADRIYFGQIEFDYGSMMVNLAYYWRLIISVLVIHLVFKIISLFINKKNKNNIFFKFVVGCKNEISEVFYVRYLAETNIFLWIGMIVELVSTSREWTLQQLSLAFDIWLLIFLLWFIYMFIWAFIFKKMRESERGFYMSFFLIKKSLWAIFIVSFAYINKEAQLSILFSIQAVFIVLEIIFRPGKNILNTVWSVFSNIVFLIQSFA